MIVDSVLKQALILAHLYLSNIELVDYKVRILDPEAVTAAATCITIEFKT